MNCGANLTLTVKNKNNVYFGFTALHIALQKNDSINAKMLITEMAKTKGNLDIPINNIAVTNYNSNFHNFTPLALAAFKKREDLVKLLKEKGANSRLKVKNEKSEYNDKDADDILNEPAKEEKETEIEEMEEEIEADPLQASLSLLKAKFMHITKTLEVN
ncbi:ankyrin repeat domain-containing protein [bacterium]|nr:ankyrin repeat domain-containing protein [bacterium]